MHIQVSLPQNDSLSGHKSWWRFVVQCVKFKDEYIKGLKAKVWFIESGKYVTLSPVKSFK